MHSYGAHARGSVERFAGGASVTQAVWVVAIAWFASCVSLGASGLVSTHVRLIGLAVLVPVASFAVLFAGSSSLRAWVRGFDLKTLVGLQTARMAGLAFLAVYAVGRLNRNFALWAGVLDCATGLSAPFVAHYLLPPRTARMRTLLGLWMAFGIADFVVAVPLARFCRLEDTAGMLALSRLPLSLITTFFVPIALIDYFMLGAILWPRGASGASP